MKLYIAGLYASHFHIKGNLFHKCNDASKRLREQVKHRLESYHYIHKGNYVRNLRADGVKVFLDSGAFSSFSLGVDVSIEAYAEFLKEHDDILLHEGDSVMASVLDAIGDPEGTFHNQNKLESLGVKVLPCFHYGEPFDLAEYYVRNYDYITIGGMVPISNGPLQTWLDELWSKVLTDRDGYSRIKIHGFGLTSRELMARYPWYSCDSSSWVQAASNGNIVMPEIERIITVSAKSPARKKWGQHFNTLPPPTQVKIEAALRKHGLTIEDVRDDYKPRWALNCYSFDKLGEMLGEDHWRKPFHVAQEGLF